MAIVVLVMGVAVPSLTGQMQRRKLQDSFDRLGELISQARVHSVREAKPYLLAWDKAGKVSLFPADLNLEERRKQGATASLLSDYKSERYTLFRPSSLSADPPAEWTFWPTGTCEPVIVKYAGGSGTWEAAFNPLSGRGTMTRFIAQ